MDLSQKKTGCASEQGARLDTAADIIFVATVIIKCAPAVKLPVLTIIWGIVIALIKIANIVFGFMKNGKLTSVHSVLNKIAGGLLFVFPLIISVFDIKYSAVAVCTVATIAAVYETVAVIRK